MTQLDQTKKPTTAPSSVLDQTCQYVKVNLKKDISKSLGSYQATYSQISTKINENPSWISILNSRAIWYIPRKKFWLIGELSRIGKDYGSIFGSNGTSGDLFDENIVWNYFNDDWKEAETNDIDVHCLTKEGTIRVK